MPLPTVTINTLQGGLSRRNPSADGVVGLLAHGVATGDIALNERVVLYTLKAAENLGVTAQYDIDEEVLVHYHLKEIFRINPSAEVHLMLIDQATTLADIFDPAEEYAKKLLREADGRIRALGVAINTASPTAFSAIEAIIGNAQALADSEFQEHRPVDILIEGKNLPSDLSTAPDLTALAAPDVSVVVGMDGTQADLDAAFAGHAAIGTALGSYAKNAIHESIAWAAKNNLTKEALEAFVDIRLSNNDNVQQVSATDLDTLNDKGYIFVRTFAGYPGSYWNNDPTCTQNASDYSRIYLNRTIKKAIRITYQTCVPRVNSPLRIDAATGRLDKVTKAAIEADVRSAVAGAMAGQISGEPLVIADPEVDEDGNLFPGILTDSTLRVMVGIIPFGKAEQVVAYIGFINPATQLA